MKIQGILFDLDGTLLNTNELNFQSFEYALDTVLHTTVSRDILTQTFGKPLQSIMQELGGPQWQELRQAFLDYAHSHEELISLCPGAAEALVQLQALHIRMALVTSRLRQSALHDLELFQLTPYFDTFITPESTIHHKPHPEPAQKAALELKLLPGQTIFVGDSNHDLQCGKEAGCLTAAVDYSLLDPVLLRQCQPDYHIEDLTQLIEIIQQEA